MTNKIGMNGINIKHDLTDKNGNPVKIDTIPDRTKGYVMFGGNRSALSKQIITEQVYDIALNLFKTGVQFDEENADWVIFPDYILPANWHYIAKRTPLMIVFPTQYPQIPPVGCYMKGDIPESANGHMYKQAYHEADKAPLEAGWQWYCVYVKPGTWRPVRYNGKNSWKRGDNLWDYVTLITEVLGTTESSL